MRVTMPPAAEIQKQLHELEVLEAEAVLFYPDGLDHLSPERLVTPIHIAQLEAGERVGGGQDRRSKRCPG